MKEKRYKCVIVEDEQHTARLMENYVSQVTKIELIGSFISPLELLNFERLSEVQIMYLDIQTPGMTGVDFIKSIPNKAEIIFATAYSEYALDGYNLNITYYLLKPVELPRFIQATDKAIKQIELKNQPSASQEQEHVMLKVDKKLMRVALNDIVYIESDWNYVYVHTIEKRLVVLSTMKKMEELFSPHNFIRIHKSFLINLNFFESIEGNTLIVNGNKLLVSRGYKNSLLEALNVS